VTGVGHVVDQQQALAGDVGEVGSGGRITVAAARTSTPS
jgi:hypothetical protein